MAPRLTAYSLLFVESIVTLEIVPVVPGNVSVLVGGIAPPVVLCTLSKTLTVLSVKPATYSRSFAISREIPPTETLTAATVGVIVLRGVAAPFAVLAVKRLISLLGVDEVFET